MIEISYYNYDSSIYGLYRKILSKVTLSDDINLSERETLFIKDICNRIEKSKTVLYTIELNNEIIGLVALCAASIQDQASLQIDYIFVNNKYRGKNIQELDNLKPFRYLIEFTINIAKEIKSKIGLRYIVLSPDTDELKHKYKKVNFELLDEDWMYLKI